MTTADAIPVPSPLPPADARAVRRWLGLAFGACALALVGGVGGVLAYVPGQPGLAALGITLQHLRPLHTTFAVGWVFAGAVAVMLAYAASAGRPLAARGVGRTRIHAWAWVAGAAGITASLVAGVFSGREYLEFHPLCSVPILLGWSAFASDWARATGFRLRDQPVYVWMWHAGICLFLVTFVEAHLWLLAPVGENPVRDVQIQWRSYGALVGSFNLCVYGSLGWVGEQLSGDPRWARSRTAFSLFAVGLLNSLTNYAHHTYHVPQSPVVKWIAFVVSMAEIVILAKVMLDLWRVPGAWLRTARPGAVHACFAAATAWTALQVGLAIALSVPPLNTFVHGTHVVTAHAMGSMLGIDSMVLFGAAAWILVAAGAPAARVWYGPVVLGAIAFMNVALLAFWGGLLTNGLAEGLRRYLGPSAPATYGHRFPLAFGIAGAAVAVGIWVLLAVWGAAAWRAGRSAARGPEPAPEPAAAVTA